MTIQFTRSSTTSCLPYIPNSLKTALLISAEERLLWSWQVPNQRVLAPNKSSARCRFDVTQRFWFHWRYWSEVAQASNGTQIMGHHNLKRSRSTMFDQFRQQQSNKPIPPISCGVYQPRHPLFVFLFPPREWMIVPSCTKRWQSGEALNHLIRPSKIACARRSCWTSHSLRASSASAGTMVSHGSQFVLKNIWHGDITSTTSNPLKSRKKWHAAKFSWIFFAAAASMPRWPATKNTKKAKSHMKIMSCIIYFLPWCTSLER